MINKTGDNGARKGRVVRSSALSTLCAVFAMMGGFCLAAPVYAQSTSSEVAEIDALEYNNIPLSRLARQTVKSMEPSTFGKVTNTHKVIAIAPLISTRDGIAEDRVNWINTRLSAMILQQIREQDLQDYLSVTQRDKQALDKVWAELQSFGGASYADFSKQLEADILFYPKVELQDDYITLLYEGVALEGDRKYLAFSATDPVRLRRDFQSAPAARDVVLKTLAKDLYETVTTSDEKYRRVQMTNFIWKPIETTARQIADESLQDDLLTALQAELNKVIQGDLSRTINPRKHEQVADKITVQSRIRRNREGTIATLSMAIEDEQEKLKFKLQERLRCKDLPEACESLNMRARVRVDGQATAMINQEITELAARGAARNLARVRAVAAKLETGGDTFSQIVSPSDGVTALSRLRYGFTYEEEWAPADAGDTSQYTARLSAKVHPLNHNLNLVDGELNRRIFSVSPQTPKTKEFEAVIKAHEPVMIAMFNWNSNDTISALPFLAKDDYTMTAELKRGESINIGGFNVGPFGGFGANHEALIVLASQDNQLNTEGLASMIGSEDMQANIDAATPMDVFLDRLHKALRGRSDIQLLVLPFFVSATAENIE